jgi:hypothetical protein
MQEEAGLDHTVQIWKFENSKSLEFESKALTVR